MQFIVQLIKKQYEKFRTHEMNQRFMQEEFYFAYSLAIAALKIFAKKEINQPRIERINKLQQIAIITPLMYAQKITKKNKYNDKEELNRAMNKSYTNMKDTINSKIGEEISKDMTILNEFFRTYKDIVITTERPDLPTNQPGIISIGHPYMTYDKHTTQRGI